MYLTGAIITFFVLFTLAVIEKKQKGDKFEGDIEDIIVIGFFFGAFSWLGLAAFVILYFVEKIAEGEPEVKKHKRLYGKEI